MNWKPVTERDYDPNPKADPLSAPLPFLLTPQERDQAKIVSIALERNRRKQNEMELRHALERQAMQPEPPEAA